MSERIPISQLAALTGAKTAPRTARSRPTSPATARAGGPSKANPKPATTRKRAKVVKLVATGGLNPASAPTRGPWTVAVDWLGRPPTVNAERSGAMSYATFKLVREAQAAWKASFVEAIRHAGIPRMTEAHVTIQAFYPNGVVPDSDGLAPAVKAGLDSLVEAGVLANDKRAQLPLGFLMLPPVTDGGLPRVAMTIHPLS